MVAPYTESSWTGKPSQITGWHLSLSPSRCTSQPAQTCQMNLDSWQETAMHLHRLMPLELVLISVLFHGQLACEESDPRPGQLHQTTTMSNQTSPRRNPGPQLTSLSLSFYPGCACLAARWRPFWATVLEGRFGRPFQRPVSGPSRPPSLLTVSSRRLPFGMWLPNRLAT